MLYPAELWARAASHRLSGMGGQRRHAETAQRGAEIGRGSRPIRVINGFPDAASGPAYRRSAASGIRTIIMARASTGMISKALTMGHLSFVGLCGPPAHQAMDCIYDARGESAVLRPCQLRTLLPVQFSHHLVSGNCLGSIGLAELPCLLRNSFNSAPRGPVHAVLVIPGPERN